MTRIQISDLENDEDLSSVWGGFGFVNSSLVEKRDLGTGAGPMELAPDSMDPGPAFYYNDPYSFSGADPYAYYY
jgi:hypothetical protein